jgi:HEAT repeat protein
MLGDVDASVRVAAVEGLMRMGVADEPVVAFYQAKLADESYEVRKSGAFALGRIGGPVATTSLVAALKGERDHWVIDSVIKALATAKNDEATEALIEKLADVEFKQRIHVAEALANVGTRGDKR